MVRNLPTGSLICAGLTGLGVLLLVVADLIGFRSQRAETVFVPLWLTGWILLVWAALVGVAVAVGAVRRRARG